MSYCYASHTQTNKRMWEKEKKRRKRRTKITVSAAGGGIMFKVRIAKSREHRGRKMHKKCNGKNAHPGFIQASLV